MVTLIERTLQQPVSTHLRAGAAAHLIVDHLGDLIARADAHLTRERYTDDTFTKDDSYRLRGHESFGESHCRVAKELDGFSRRFKDQEVLVKAFAAVLSAVRRDSPSLVETGLSYRAALEAFRDEFEPAASAPLAQVAITDEGISAWVNLLHPVQASGDQRFLAAITQLLELRRNSGDHLTPDERIAVRAAYWLIDRGIQIPTSYPIWGTSGFRDVQTYASITDPGEGHLAGTVLRQENLHGVIVHVEHLERGVDRSREELEPYRIPSPRTVARVRLHVGSAAPTSSYIGRPLFDGTVEDSLIKTSRTFAAAATSLLADGLAEVKFAVERMTASEAVQLLSSLANEVRRDRYAQVLSAAFNINVPLLDDRPEVVAVTGEPRWARTQREIGLLGVEIAAAAGFDKVTWDGTADTYPSRCITDQLTKPVTVELVHRAHEAGLLTYFSAGFRFSNIPDAVTTGVDGIGIGGAQILRYMDKKTGNHGPFLPDNIARILAVRDQSADSVLGRGAQLLARLDRLYYEGTLDLTDDPLRIELFQALQQGDEVGTSRMIEALPHVIERGHDIEQPLFAWAHRLLTSGDVLAKRRIHEESWEPLLAMVRNALARNDASALAGHLRAISA
ncbi:hypothetical protein [Glutamicibacter nicotianae]|uniref:hypothetical protein n=1 Tax=Glutamicibacter nicotianae TaxID=37929 RepID=UPI0019595A9D|nr:hypothetical protein [Glutamicibacter nicotianae]MBM7767788.1 hypothetical protein [Glutamicibacter nicotianae]